MSEASSEGEWTPAASSSEAESEQQEALPLSSSLGASGGSTPRTPADAAAQVRLLEFTAHSALPAPSASLGASRGASNLHAC